MLRIRDNVKLIRAIRGAVVVSSLLFISINLVTKGLDVANQSSSVVAALVALLALVGVVNPSPAENVEDRIGPILAEVRETWNRQARQRQLTNLDFIPLRVSVLSGLENNLEAGQYLRTAPVAAKWTFEQTQKVCAAAVYRFNVERAVVFGAPGTGKSTLALALTLGLANRYSLQQLREQGDNPPPPIGRIHAKALVPITLSLASWDFRYDTFASWLNRRLETTYSQLSEVRRPASGGIAQSLIDSQRFVFILDGLDEVLADDISEAIKEIDKFFPVSQRLCILSRDSLRDKFNLTRSVQLRLCKSTRNGVQLYLDSVIESDDLSELNPLRQQLDTPRVSSLAAVLVTPMYLRMAYRTILAGRVTAAQLTATPIPTSSDIKKLLHAAEIDLALNSASEEVTELAMLQAKNSRKWLTYLAADLETRQIRAFAWWRMADGIDRWLLVSLSSLLCIPAYLLVFVMPVGLTRGLAVGAIAGAMYGLLRGYPASVTNSLTAAASCWLLVFALGWIGFDAKQGAADATELALSTLFILIGKEALVSGNFRRFAPWTNRQRVQLPLYLELPGAVIFCALAGVVTGFTVSIVSRSISFVDPDRDARSIGFSVFIVIVVATAAARLLISTPRDRMQASRIRLLFRKRVRRLTVPMRSAITAASLVGIGGGLGGGVRYGSEYGLSLVLFYGLTLGIPAGLAAGLVKWLSYPLKIARPIPSDAEDFDGAPLRGDTIVAIVSILGLSLASFLTLLGFTSLLNAPVQIIESVNASRGLHLQPVQGLLYGLMMGIVVACFFTAWPTFQIALSVLAISRRVPWRISRFLRALVQVGILRNEGPLLLFSHREIQLYLRDEA